MQRHSPGYWRDTDQSKAPGNGTNEPKPHFNSEEFNEDEQNFGSLLDDIEKYEFNKKKNNSRDMFLNHYPNCLDNIVSQSTQINII